MPINQNASSESHSNKPLVFFIAVAIIIFFSIFYFLRPSLRQTSASVAKVYVLFNPSKETYAVQQPLTSSLILHTSSTKEKISGVSITLNASDSITLKDIEGPYAINGTVLNAKLTSKTISDHQATFGYTLENPVDALPEAVNFQISYMATSPGIGSISFSTASSQITGPITGDVYLWGKIENAFYTFK